MANFEPNIPTMCKINPKYNHSWQTQIDKTIINKKMYENKNSIKNSEFTYETVICTTDARLNLTNVTY